MSDLEKQKIFDEHKINVDITVNKYYNNTTFLNTHMVELDDVKQLGYMILWNAIEAYKPSKKNKFSTYLLSFLKKDILRKVYEYSLRNELKTEERIIRNYDSIDAPVGDSDEDMVLGEVIGSPDDMNTIITDRYIINEMKDCDEITASIIRMKLEEKTNVEIAEYLGMSETAIRKRIKKNEKEIREIINNITY